LGYLYALGLLSRHFARRRSVAVVLSPPARSDQQMLIRRLARNIMVIGPVSMTP
jgi:hypothetical protein